VASALAAACARYTGCRAHQRTTPATFAAAAVCPGQRLGVLHAPLQGQAVLADALEGLSQGLPQLIEAGWSSDMISNVMNGFTGAQERLSAMSRSVPQASPITAALLTPQGSDVTAALAQLSEELQVRGHGRVPTPQPAGGSSQRGRGGVVDRGQGWCRGRGAARSDRVTPDAALPRPWLCRLP